RETSVKESSAISHLLSNQAGILPAAAGTCMFIATDDFEAAGQTAKLGRTSLGWALSETQSYAQRGRMANALLPETLSPPIRGLVVRRLAGGQPAGAGRSPQ